MTHHTGAHTRAHADAHGGPKAWFAALLGPSLVWALVVALSVTAWAWTGHLQRHDAVNDLDDAAQVAAGFTDTYLTSVAEQQQKDAAWLLTGSAISQHDLELFGSGFGYGTTSVFDDQGRIMVTWPSNPSLIGVNIAAKQEHIRTAAQDGKITISGTFMSLSLRRPIVSIAIPFSTPYGRRVFAGGVIVKGSRLGAYLDEAAVPTKGRAYYVDRAGNVVAATVPLGGKVTSLAALEPSLAKALSRSPHGVRVDQGRRWRYASSPVPVSGWRLVTEAPERELYADVDAAQLRYGAVLVAVSLLGLGGVTALSIAIYRRRLADRRLRGLNEQIADQAKELKAANHELEAFSYGLVNDLRSPLHAAGTRVRRLLDDSTGRLPDDATLLITKIQGDIDGMDETIKALMSYSRAQREQMHVETVEPAALVRQIWDGLADRRHGRDVRLDLGPLPPCSADRDLLRQALEELLDNAIKFTRDESVALIEIGGAAGPEGLVTYHVKDNGMGFPPAEAGRLFRPFRRFGAAEDHPGTGIGLAIADRIIARHGGRLTAESTPGEGAVFTFTLPSSATSAT